MTVATSSFKSQSTNDVTSRSALGPTLRAMERRIWNDEEIQILAAEYFRVLREQHSGGKASKSEAFARARAAGVDRSAQTMQDRCQRISEELSKRGLPWADGWSPTGATRSPNSPGVSASIWRTVRPMLVDGLPPAFWPTSDPADLERRARLATFPLGSTPPQGNATPGVRSTTSSVVQRDPLVIAWVRAHAGGRCELCCRAAPFRDVHGEPYLEVHHVRRLADGGSDTIGNAVALCANCHRRLHVGADADGEREKLYGAVGRLARE